MPVHRVPKDEAEAKYAEIQRVGWVVEHVVVDGDYFLFFTSSAPTLETRTIVRPI